MLIAETNRHLRWARMTCAGSVRHLRLILWSSSRTLARTSVRDPTTTKRSRFTDAQQDPDAPIWGAVSGLRFIVMCA